MLSWDGWSTQVLAEQFANIKSFKVEHPTMKTRLTTLTWRGSASVDPRFSASMLPWSIADIRNHESYVTVSIPYREKVLKSFNKSSFKAEGNHFLLPVLFSENSCIKILIFLVGRTEPEPHTEKHRVERVREPFFYPCQVTTDRGRGSNRELPAEE